MERRLYFLMFLVLVLSSCVRTSPSSLRGEALIIASGTFVSNGVRSAVYHIDEVIAGNPPRTNIVVYFYGDTIPLAGLPKKALLVVMPDYEIKNPVPLDDFRFRLHESLGMDAGRGILPDTPATREELRNADLDLLATSPQRLWLSETDAVAKAKSALLQKGYSEELSLSGVHRAWCDYAWDVTFTDWGPLGNGIDVDVIVGDDGYIKAIESFRL